MKRLPFKFKANMLEPYNIEKVLMKGKTNDNEYCKHFDSWSEAHEWMLSEAKSKFVTAQAGLTFRKNIFDKINLMVKP